MHSHFLVSGLPRSLPPLPTSPAPPCLPYVEGRQRAAPHSSSFPPTTAPLKTLHMDGEVLDVLIPWIRAVCLYLGEHFGEDLPVLRLHSDRGGEFSSDLLRDFCHGEGITQSFTLPTSPQQNGIAERRIGLVMEVARTSMIHAAAPHFLWPFAVRLAMRRCSGSEALVPLFAIRLRTSSPPALFPASSLASPLTRLAGSYPLPVTVPVKVAGDSGAARGAASGGAAFGGEGPGGAEPGGAESEGAGSGGAGHGGAEPRGVEPGGAEPEGVEPGGAESEGAEFGGAEPRGAALLGGPAVALLEPLSLRQLREWLVQRARLRSGATGAGGARVTAGVGGTGGTSVAGPGGARTRGTRAAGTGHVGGTGAGALTEPGATGAGGTDASGAGAGGAGARGTGAGGAGAGGAGAIDLGAGGAGGTVHRDRTSFPYFSRFLLQPPLQPASPLPAPSPYTEQSGGLTEHRDPASRPVSPVRAARRVPRPCPSPVPGTHAMALRPSSAPLRVPLPPPPESSLPAVPDPKFDLVRAASPTVSRLLTTVVTDPAFESAVASALVAEPVGFATACRLDYATALVDESEPAGPPSVGGECALGTDVLEDKQEDFDCLAAAVPRFASMLLAPQGDPDAPDIPTPRSYAEAITGPYSSQWQAAMDAEMASWKSTGTYVDEVPPPGANIVDGMWIFRVKRPPGSPPAFKARYVA
ncbi:unnamed protein product [Closterium sp. NIES-53]